MTAHKDSEHPEPSKRPHHHLHAAGSSSSDVHEHHPAQRTKSSGSTGGGGGGGAVGSEGEHWYPRGHLTHLTAEEDAALQRFKKLIEEKGLYTPGPPASHEDHELLRFVRARRWVVEDAYKQFSDTVAWRKANDIDVLYQTIDIEAYEQSRRMYPQWTGRRDRRGIPLYVFDIKTLDSKNVSSYEKAGTSTTVSDARFDGKTPPGLMRLFALYENLIRFNMPLCTQLQDREFAGTPVTISTNIVDVSGVGLKQFWNLKAHMQAASQLATAYYPETLDRIYIVGAPMFFSTVWGWIKRWFDPITVSKIFVLGAGEVRPTLTRFVEPANLPRKYGGELDWQFGQMPTVDPAWEGVVEWEAGEGPAFVSEPCSWRPSADGERMELWRMGKQAGRPREGRVCSVWRTYFGPRGREVNGVKVREGEEEEEGSREEAAQTDLTAQGDGFVKVDEKERAGGGEVTSGEAMEKLTVGDAKEAATDGGGEKEKDKEDIPAVLPTTVA